MHSTCNNQHTSGVSSGSNLRRSSRLREKVFKETEKKVEKKVKKKEGKTKKANQKKDEIILENEKVGQKVELEKVEEKYRLNNEIIFSNEQEVIQKLRKVHVDTKIIIKQEESVFESVSKDRDRYIEWNTIREYPKSLMIIPFVSSLFSCFCPCMFKDKPNVAVYKLLIHAVDCYYCEYTLGYEIIKEMIAGVKGATIFNSVIIDYEELKHKKQRDILKRKTAVENTLKEVFGSLNGMIEKYIGYV